MLGGSFVPTGVCHSLHLLFFNHWFFLSPCVEYTMKIILIVFANSEIVIIHPEVLFFWLIFFFPVFPLILRQPLVFRILLFLCLHLFIYLFSEFPYVSNVQWITYNLSVSLAESLEVLLFGSLVILLNMCQFYSFSVTYKIN